MMEMVAGGFSVQSLDRSDVDKVWSFKPDIHLCRECAKAYDRDMREVKEQK